MSPLEAAAARLVQDHRAVLVVGYGSFAAGTSDRASDVDVAAWAPVESPRHLSGPVEGHELDAWVYPLAHPFLDEQFVRFDPLVCLYDGESRFADLAAAVAETRRLLVVPAGAAARDELLAWARKMVVRASDPTPEGLHRYHWLVSELPEIWCATAGLPWEAPALLAELQALWAQRPSAEAVARWLDKVQPA